MINYIVDEDGNKTHAVVPIDKWEFLKEQSKQKTKQDEFSDLMFNSFNAVKGRTFPANIKDVNGILLTDSSNLGEIVPRAYSYFHQLEANDIAFLYLMRESDFNLLMSLDAKDEKNKDIKDLCNILAEEYYITNAHRKTLSPKEFQKLQSLLLDTAKPLELISHFNANYHFGVKNFTKRIRKDAEIKRFFFYDLHMYIPMMLPNLVNEFGGKKAFMEHIAHLAYPNNSKESAISQMNKALRDAQERVNGKWKEYIR